MAGATKEFEPSKIQEACIFYEGGDLLVRGVAGSGKSLVLMKRAVALNKKAIEKGVDIRIAIFTYANTLVKYTSDLIYWAGLGKDNRMIQINTLDSYCTSLYSKIAKNKKMILYNDNDGKKIKKECIEHAIQAHLSATKKDHRLYHLEPAFWQDEFRWIKEKRILNAAAYIDSDRTGRGGKIRLSRPEKAMAYELLEKYNSIIAKQGFIDSEDCFNYIIDHSHEVPEELKYDYILIDEAQDLSLVRLMMAKKMTLKAITIAADQAQKIYSTSFSWQDIGINIKGQGSKALGETFRSTKQIILLADNLLIKNKDRLSACGEYTEPVLPDKEGNMPIIVQCMSSAAEKDLILKTLKSLSAEKNQVVGVLCHTHSEISTIISWLNSESLKYEKVDKKNDWNLSVPGIKIMTIHSAKGLEMDTVIIPHFTQNLYPLDYAVSNCDPDQTDEIIAQERSLLYVGMTRARNDLMITYSGTPSQFLEEIDRSLYRHIDAGKGSGSEAFDFKIEKKVEDSHLQKSAGTSASDAKAAVESKLMTVKDGSTVYAIMLSKNSQHTFVIDLKKYSMQKSIVGKKAGDVFSMRGDEYQISRVV